MAVSLAGGPRQADRRTRQRLAVPGSFLPLVENGTGMHVSTAARSGVDIQLWTTVERRLLMTEVTGDRRRHHLALRHDGRARRVPAQHGELVAGHAREPDLRQHVERPGRKPRERAVAEGSGDHRPRQDDREARVGGRIAGREDSARQWSSPAVGKVGDGFQVVVGQGDGFVRGYEAKSGKKLWEFDTNPKDSVWPKTRNEVISTPIVHEGIVYIANGQDPEHGEGVGHLYAIDPTKTGDITKSGLIWHYTDIRRSISTGAIY
jgi:hypothetical protein